MSKKAKTTAIAVKDQVPTIISKLDQEIAKLKVISESVYKTAGKLETFGDIKVETKVENLVRAYSSISGKKEAYDRAARELGVKQCLEFSINGGTLAEWKQDIMLRIDIITHQDKLDKLKSYKDKMSKFLSEEDQKAILMQEMTEFLSGN